MVALTTPTLTVAEFLALPKDGIRRSYIHGIVREEGMTIRNRFHCAVLANLSLYFGMWLLNLRQKPGQILSGEAGVQLSSDVLVGADFAYVSNELLAQQTDESTIIQGVPELIAEILSPSDTIELVHEKITEYLNAGVNTVWILNPYERTVGIYQPNRPPMHVNVEHVLTAEPLLPGFSVRVADLFPN